MKVPKCSRLASAMLRAAGTFTPRRLVFLSWKTSFFGAVAALQLPKLLSQLFSGAVFTRFARSVLEPELLKNFSANRRCGTQSPCGSITRANGVAKSPAGSLSRALGELVAFGLRCEQPGNPVVAL